VRRQLQRASRQDYEVVVELGDAAQRAAAVGWFDEHLTPLRANQAMRRQVLDTVAAKPYPPEYVALFKAAARGHHDDWPRSQDGRVWRSTTSASCGSAGPTT
jgi:hypothetical protein